MEPYLDTYLNLIYIEETKQEHQELIPKCCHTTKPCNDNYVCLDFLLTKHRNTYNYYQHNKKAAITRYIQGILYTYTQQTNALTLQAEGEFTKEYIIKTHNALAPFLNFTVPQCNHKQVYSTPYELDNKQILNTCSECGLSCSLEYMNTKRLLYTSYLNL